MRLVGTEAVEYKRYYGDAVNLRKSGDTRGGPRKNLGLEEAEQIDKSLLYADTTEEVGVSIDWDHNPEATGEWWDAVQEVKDEPYLLQLMLAESGPDAVQCSAAQAVEIKKWAAELAGWKNKDAPRHSPHPLAFRDLPRYRVEKVMSKRGWGTAKEMAEESNDMLSPEQAREALRNLNERKMTLDTVIRLCKTLGVSMDDIFGSNPRWY